MQFACQTTTESAKRKNTYQFRCSACAANRQIFFSGRGDAYGSNLFFSGHILNTFPKPTILQLNIEGFTASKINLTPIVTFPFQRTPSHRIRLETEDMRMLIASRPNSFLKSCLTSGVQLRQFSEYLKKFLIKRIHGCLSILKPGKAPGPDSICRKLYFMIELL